MTATAIAIIVSGPIALVACLVLIWVTSPPKGDRAQEPINWDRPDWVVVPNEDPKRWPARQDTTVKPPPRQRPPRLRASSEAYRLEAGGELTKDIVPRSDDPYGDEAVVEWYRRTDNVSAGVLALMAEMQRGRQQRQINGRQP